MANLNTPAHDFAPPWLKIPTYDSAKPSGAERDRGGHASRKEGHSYGSARYAKDSDNFVAPRHHFYNDSRRDRNTFSGERKPSYLTSYHHSLDFDDSYFEVNSGQSTYTDNSCNGTCNSQSALLRRPHSRHDFRNVPASYSKGDGYNRHLSNNTGSFYSKAKGKFADPSTTNNSNSIFNENGGINVSSNNFNQEFPSLQGDISEEPSSPPPTVNGGVWEKHRNMTVHGGGVGKKIQLIKKPFNSDANTDSSKKGSSATSLCFPSSSSLSSSGISSSISNPHTVIVTPVAKGASGIYRALIPAKCTSSIKKSAVMKDGPLKTQPNLKKPPNSSAALSTHSMEILVKHPKAPGNKSEFLKALRNENKNSSKVRESQGKKTTPEFGSCTENPAEIPHTNGIDIAKMSISDSKEKPMLSSSLEAEQRLLKEMGWKEDASDDDNYAPLTEDEMREFRALSEQIAKKNGVRRSLQTNFSPRRLAPFSNVTLPTDTCSSSSESDSDF